MSLGRGGGGGGGEQMVLKGFRGAGLRGLWRGGWERVCCGASGPGLHRDLWMLGVLQELCRRGRRRPPSCATGLCWGTVLGGGAQGWGSGHAEAVNTARAEVEGGHWGGGTESGCCQGWHREWGESGLSSVPRSSSPELGTEVLVGWGGVFRLQKRLLGNGWNCCDLKSK